jgi:hypothetical protein
MRVTRNILLSICIILPAAVYAQESGGKEIKDAGNAAKTAVVKTGEATGKATATGAKKTAKAVKKGAKATAKGTGTVIEKGGKELKEVGTGK